MAKRNRFADVFFDEYSKEIEQSTKRNIDRINSDVALKKSHAKIVQILLKNGQDQNEYLNVQNYVNLVNKLKKDKIQKQKNIATN